MSSSGKRLRIMLIVAISIVIANIYLVLNGTSDGFYAGLSKELMPDKAPTATVVAHKSGPKTTTDYSFAAFETRVQRSYDLN